MLRRWKKGRAERQLAQRLVELRLPLDRQLDEIEAQLRAKLMPEIADRLARNVERERIAIGRRLQLTAEQISTRWEIPLRRVIDELERLQGEDAQCSG
jgi:hypothetical protein